MSVNRSSETIAREKNWQLVSESAHLVVKKIGNWIWPLNILILS